MIQWFDSLISSYGLPEPAASGIALVIVILGVLALAAVADRVIRFVLRQVSKRLVTRTEAQWDDHLEAAGFFNRLAHFAPGIVVYSFAETFGAAESWIERLSLIYILLIAARVIDSVLQAALRVYQATDASRQRPIQGWMQLGSLMVHVIAGIVGLSVLLDREPWGLLTGLGAASAILLLVFRDSILGFVASVQLASNNMVRRGDWIEMPAHNTDGEVIEISLYTVKVQNWDKTISTIPTQMLVNESFRNWRGMEESDGRRIKRALNIDVGTIRLCSDEMLERFEHFDLIGDYVRQKRQELSDYNLQHNIDANELVNGRRLTNVGTFRAYIAAYLKNNPKINQSMTFLVRQLNPGNNGLPIEIYVFSADQVWANFEAIQSDIFDHLLAVAPEFGLRIYQSPSGHDLLDAAEEVGREKRSG